MMRQELNQTRWDISKHNGTAFKCLGLVIALYMFVGFVERMA